jgi:hypothetical protein
LKTKGLRAEFGLADDKSSQNENPGNLDADAAVLTVSLRTAVLSPLTDCQRTRSRGRLALDGGKTSFSDFSLFPE